MTMKTVNGHLSIFAVVLFAGMPVHAVAQDSAAYYRVGSQSVAFTETGADSEVLLEKPAQLSAPDKQVVEAAGIINAGAAAWKVINDNAASFESEASYASAIPPRLYANWSGVAAWKGPREYVYNYKVTNLLGMDVVDVKYKIAFYYGGTENGQNKPSGSYISNFIVKPVSVHIKWGWHFNLEVGMSHPMNIGTVASPVAFLQADLKWRLSTMMSKDGEVGIWSYTVDGKGNYRDLTAEQKALTKGIPYPADLPQFPVSWN
ncbi:MAG: hypothetical protein A2234_07295 [Elusimicrobia bacterium RIFOXYA2_FULL_58_8]|nr:MAG: hypothetical protein A2234_07295 [Elusimicrobia bacterium RIFOXYA2_FULL_58_8]OGS13311.1 MAG: hypothetical protein A2285_02020 [Elusimicrobia bacterium RIFOXYA12_FULL_57_11]